MLKLGQRTLTGLSPVVLRSTRVSQAVRAFSSATDGGSKSWIDFSRKINPKFDEAERDTDEFDVVIVGAGTSPTNIQHETPLRVCVLEKGAEVGSHIVSGAILEPRAINELIPDWKEKGAPINTPVTSDSLLFLTETSSMPLPIISHQNNHGNYIVSLGAVCRWLGQQAEELGVEVYTGQPAASFIWEDNAVRGVITRDVGIEKNGKIGPNFEPGMALRGRLTFLGEGARGHLTKSLFRHSPELRKDSDPQAFGIGLKEVWEIQPGKHVPGKVVHSLGWPLGLDTYGGSFMYHWGDNLVSIGYVIGLDYTNPYLNPYRTFQQFKHHPMVKTTLEGGRCVSYGARAINTGGVQALPQLHFPGGLFMGCAAGFLNFPKIKGSHTAMKSGMLAAESAFEYLKNPDNTGPIDPKDYTTAVKNSWLWDELYAVRNLKPAFQKYGVVAGALYTGVETVLLRNKAPWTWPLTHEDNKELKPKDQAKPITYPTPDGVLSFDLLTNLARSGTNHNEDQPAHLLQEFADQPEIARESRAKYDGPETRYCPAGVYEWIADDKGGERLVINAQNCLHCKTCDIKDPRQNLNWYPPEGGGGPSYSNM